MDINPILQFIADYGYWIAVPLMILEGPFITLIMGFFASLGFFNLAVVILLSIASDMISDGIYYTVGRHAGPEILKRLKVPDGADHETLQRFKKRFLKHPFTIFFSAKVLTGIAHSTFALAGMTRVSYGKVFRYSLPGGIVWSTALAFLGFYFGRQITSINRFLSSAGLVMFSILALFLLYEFWFGKKLSAKFAVWRRKYNHYLNETSEEEIQPKKPTQG